MAIFNGQIHPFCQGTSPWLPSLSASQNHRAAAGVAEAPWHGAGPFRRRTSCRTLRGVLAGLCRIQQGDGVVDDAVILQPVTSGTVRGTESSKCWKMYEDVKMTIQHEVGAITNRETANRNGKKNTPNRGMGQKS